MVRPHFEYVRTFLSGVKTIAGQKEIQTFPKCTGAKKALPRTPLLPLTPRPQGAGAGAGEQSAVMSVSGERIS
jgi:hypothetical protein